MHSRSLGSSGENVQALVKVAANSRGEAPRRIRSLAAIEDFFSAPGTDASTRVVLWLPSVLPSLLPLLLETVPEVRSAATSCLGVLGCQAMQYLVPPTPPPALPTPSSVSGSSLPKTSPPSSSATSLSPSSPPFIPPPPSPSLNPASPPFNPTRMLSSAPTTTPPPPPPPPPPTSRDTLTFLFDFCLDALTSPTSPELQLGVKVSLVSVLSKCMGVKGSPAGSDPFMRTMSSKVLKTSTLMLQALSGNNLALLHPLLTLTSNAALYTLTDQGGGFFQGLVDVLFKWWVEPGIAEIHRQLIIDIMMRMKDHWVKHRDYAAELAARIVSEIESMTKSGPRLKLVEETLLSSHLSALTTFLCPATTASPSLDFSSSSSISISAAQHLALILPRLSQALIKLCLSSLSSKPPEKVKGAGGPRVKEPPSLSLKVIEASCNCLSSLLPYVIEGLQDDQVRGALVNKELSSLVLQGSMGVQEESNISCQDAAFWSSSHVVEKVLLPLLNSSPASLIHVLSAVKSLFRALVSVNKARAASMVFETQGISSSSLPLLPLTSSMMPNAVVSSLWALRSSSDPQTTLALSSFLTECFELETIGLTLIRALLNELSTPPSSSSSSYSLDVAKGKDSTGGVKMDSELDLVALSAEEEEEEEGKGEGTADEDYGDDVIKGSMSPLGMSPGGDGGSLMVMGREREEDESEGISHPSAPSTVPQSAMGSQAEGEGGGGGVLLGLRRKVGDEEVEADSPSSAADLSTEEAVDNRSPSPALESISRPHKSMDGSKSSPPVEASLEAKTMSQDVASGRKGYLEAVSFNSSTLALAIDRGKSRFILLALTDSDSDEHVSFGSVRQSIVSAMKEVMTWYSSPNGDLPSLLASSSFTSAFKLWSSFLSHDLDSCKEGISELTEPLIEGTVHWLDELLSSSFIKSGRLPSSFTLEADALDLLGLTLRATSFKVRPEAPLVNAEPLPMPLACLQMIKRGAGSRQALVRSSSISSALDLAMHCGSRGQLPPSLSSSLIALALDGLHDPDPSCASKSLVLLTSLSGEAVKASSLASFPRPPPQWHAPGLTSELDGSWGLPSWHSSLSLTPQSVTFSSDQLKKVFEALALTPSSSSSPLPSSNPNKGSTSGAMLLKKPPSKPELIDAVQAPAFESSYDLLHRVALSLIPHHPHLSSLPSSSLPWMVLQEAARFLVQSKMRSHLGGPAQTFTGMEKLLQGARARPPAKGGGHDESIWLLIEFFEALERCIFTAHRGGAVGLVGAGGGWGRGDGKASSGMLLSKSTLAFFAANQKVCEDWFMGIRPLMLHLSIRSRSFHHVIKHGMGRLHDLHSALKRHQGLEDDSRKKELADRLAAEKAASLPPPADVAATDDTEEQVQEGSSMGKKGKKGGRKKGEAKLPTLISPPMILQRQKPPASDTAQSSSTTQEGTSSSSGGGQGGFPHQPSLDLLQLGMDVVSLSQHLALALLMVKDAEGIVGLQAWATRAFHPALVVLHREREKALGAVKAKQATLKPDPLPFGHRPSSSSTSPPPLHGKDVTSSSELSWMSCMASQAQGRYELSLRSLSGLLSQDSSTWDACSLEPDSLSPVLAHHVSLRRFWSERSLECLASLNDWSGLKALSSHHDTITSKGSSSKDDASSESIPTSSGSPPSLRPHSSWWKDLSHSVHAHFASAAYDTSPSSLDVKAYKGLNAIDICLFHSLQHLSHSPTAPAAVQGDMGPAWREIVDEMKESSLVGLTYPSTLPTFLHLHCLHRLALDIQDLEPAKKDTKGKTTPLPLLTPPCSSSVLFDDVGNNDDGESHLTLGRILLLPPQPMIFGPPGLPITLSSPTEIPYLMKLKRVAWASTQGSTSILRHRLLLDLMRSAREGSNYGLCGKVLGWLSSLQKERFAPRTGQAPLDPLLPLVSSATLECSLAVLQIESLGPTALPKALSRMLASLAPLLKKDPADLHSSLGANQGKEGQDLAYALVALSSWMSRTPPLVLSQVPEAASMDWLSTLKHLHSSSSSLSPGPPELLLSHPMESSCHLLAIKICPHLSHLWLQWANLLFQWTKAAALTPGQAAANDALGYASAAGAYCRYLSLSSLQVKDSDERSMVVLLRLIQVLSTASSPLTSLSSSLVSLPPATWLPVIPQLFAQLSSSSSSSSSASGSRRQILDILLSLATSSPSLILYPCVIDSFSSDKQEESSAAEQEQELHTLTSFMESSHPVMMTEAKMLAAEARRVSFTWEEKWQALLTDALSDLNKRALVLQGEIKRINSEQPASATVDQRAAAIKDKYQSLILPLVQSTLDVSLSSMSQPETPHERWFVLNVMPKIKEAVEALRSPPDELFTSLATAPPTVAAAPPATAETDRGKEAKGTSGKKSAPKMLSSSSKAKKEEKKKEEGFVLAESNFPSLAAAVAPKTQEVKKGAEPSPQVPPKPQPPSSSLSSSPPMTLASCFSPLKMIHAQLGRLLSRLAKIDLRRLSPLLSSLTSSSLPLPGHPDTILSSFLLEVHALPTKTRPKRWVMRGSDGNDHAYLLKGRDDLRADERLVQVMRLATGALAADPASSRLSLSIQSYSITPLGERTGLVQWVQGTTSFFAIFRKWQEDAQLRHAAMTAARQAPPSLPPPGPNKATKHKPPPSPSPTPSPSPLVPPLNAMASAQRPVDLFHSLLGTALIESGIKEGIMAPRSEWPPSVLKKVHQQLTSLVPHDLFSSQVWLGSSSAASHYQRVRAFNASLASNSALGYLIGLGDRHLDNILYDSRSSQVVHIDLNVCFDKGEKLRVPEIVPFRLTRCFTLNPDLRGVEGAFRAALESSLSAFRGRREGLSLLLEHILSDPGVEWSEARGGGEAKGLTSKAAKEMDQAVSLSLFATRLEQARAASKKHAEKILIPALTGPMGGALLGFIEAHSFLSGVKKEAEEADSKEEEAQELAKTHLESERLARGHSDECSHASLPLLHQASLIQSSAAPAIADCERCVEKHSAALDLIVRGLEGIIPINPLPTLMTLLPSGPEGSSILAASLPHRLDSPPPLVLTQMREDLRTACQSSDESIVSLMSRKDQVVSSTLMLLGSASTVAWTLKHLITDLRGYLSTSSHYQWSQCLSHLVRANDPVTLMQAAKAAPPPPSSSGDKVQEAVGMWLSLRSRVLLSKNKGRLQEQEPPPPFPSTDVKGQAGLGVGVGGGGGGGEGEPELIRFDQFDDNLEGAGMMLEDEGLEGGDPEEADVTALKPLDDDDEGWEATLEDDDEEERSLMALATFSWSHQHLLSPSAVTLALKQQPGLDQEPPELSSPSEAIRLFLARRTGRRNNIQVLERKELVSRLESLIVEMSSIATGLQQWLSDPQNSHQLAHQSLLSLPLPPDKADEASFALQPLLDARSTHIESERMQLQSLLDIASSWVHFERSREGEDWILPSSASSTPFLSSSPSQPFVGCYDLVARATEAAMRLFEQSEAADAFMREANEAHSRFALASSEARAARQEASSLRAQFESQVPLLVVGASDLRGFVSSLLEPVATASNGPLCSDLDKLLAQLSSVSPRSFDDDGDKSNASLLIRNVASLARKISTDHHSPIKDSIETLSSLLPSFLPAMDQVDAVLATTHGSFIPDDVLHAAVLDPSVILNDPMLTHAAHQRGLVLMQHLDPLVEKLAGEKVARLQDLVSSLDSLLTEVEALISAAQSAAAAIQSEDNVEPSAEHQGGRDNGKDNGEEAGSRSTKWDRVGLRGDVRRRMMDEESRRAFAAHALKRCAQKLEGKDPNLIKPVDAPPSAPGEDLQSQRGGQGLAPLSVSQHADRLIKVATSEDSLSQMFEGWMSWI